jgi:iron complex transport system substrate-binding protein
MRYKLLILMVILTVLMFSCQKKQDTVPKLPDKINRIVSMAPSITEVLFAVGLEDKIVGVTKYCDYPPEARKIERVGGYLDPNYEVILRLKPDIVVLLPEHMSSQASLKELNLPVLQVNHKSLEGIRNSIRSIGAIGGKQEAADSIVQDIQRRINKIRTKTAGLPKPKVMVCIGRNMGSGSLQDMYIAGQDDFYAPMIEIAGGVNAYREGTVKFPVVTAEGILQMDPDVIIDVIPDMKERGWQEPDIIKEWHKVEHVSAVKNNRIYIFSQDFVAIPGPRFVMILEEMARVIHPEKEE